MPVGRDHNLTTVFDHLHDRMQEFFLSRTLVVQKLNIIDQQDIDVAKPLPERRDCSRCERGCEIIGECFAGEVHHVFCRMLPPRFCVNGFQQMSLAGTRASVNKQGIVAFTGGCRDLSGSKCSKVVAFP